MCKSAPELALVSFSSPLHGQVSVFCPILAATICKVQPAVVPTSACVTVLKLNELLPVLPHKCYQEDGARNTDPSGAFGSSGEESVSGASITYGTSDENETKNSNDYINEIKNKFSDFGESIKYSNSNSLKLDGKEEAGNNEHLDKQLELEYPDNRPDKQLVDQVNQLDNDDHALAMGTPLQDGIENNTVPPHESGDEEDYDPYEFCPIEQCEGCRRLHPSAACSFCTYANGYP